MVLNSYQNIIAVNLITYNMNYESKNDEINYDLSQAIGKWN